MIRNIARNWVLLFALVYGVFVLLPFLAPALMQIGWQSPANAIYFVYSSLCHQLPERSYFLFGPKLMVSLPEIQAAWQNTLNPLVLRKFIGNPQMGWKVAWSDRMVSLYTSIWVFGMLWWPLRRWIRPLPWWGLVLLVLPLAIDGTTHLISDLAGFGQGFRDNNAWLVLLTQNRFPVSFYAGDAWGSLNAWLRLLTGVIFGLGVVWFGFPYIDQPFSDLSQARGVHSGPVGLSQKSIL
jgi:uncharacterized membrane protein